MTEYHQCKAKGDGLSPKCKGCVKAYNAMYYTINAEEVKKTTNAYHHANKVVSNNRSRKWTQDNLARHNQHSAKRRASKLQRTPSWLSETHRRHIGFFYQAAKTITEETGVSFVVDHIVPLQGAIVSGLHVPWNLQVITSSENASKSNKVV